MEEKSEPLFDEDHFDDEFEDQDSGRVGPEMGELKHAADARKRLEAYWEKKALEDDLKKLDDW